MKATAKLLRAGHSERSFDIEVVFPRWSEKLGIDGMPLKNIVSCVLQPSVSIENGG